MIRELCVAAGDAKSLCRMLGIPRRTLTAWLLGESLPSGTARRCVWLLWAILLHPERCRTLFDVSTWGRFRSYSPCGVDTPTPSGSDGNCAKPDTQDGKPQ